MAYSKIADNLKIFSARAGDALLMLYRCSLTSLVTFGAGINQIVSVFLKHMPEMS